MVDESAGASDSKALDFAGDAPHSDILPMLQESLAGYAKEAQQGASADASAAATGQPPPVLTAPGTIASDTNALYTPQAPDTNAPNAPVVNAAMPGGAPGAPAPQVPPPTVAPQKGPQLSPQSLNNAAETDQAKAESDLNNAAALKAQAAEAKKSEDLQNAQDQQPFLDHAVKMAQAKDFATDQVANFITNAQQQELADVQSDIDKHTALAKEKPEEWWANHDTGSRISAVIGMIGATMTGMSRTQYFDTLVNKDIATHNRKVANLEALQALHQKKYNITRQIAKDASTSIETRYIASMKLIAAQMEAKANQSSNAKAKANYQSAVAEIYTKLADDQAKLVNQKLGKRIDEESNAIKWAQLGIERQRMNQVQTPNDDSVPFDVAEQTIPGGKQGVPKNLSVGVKKDVDSKVDLLNNLDQIEAMWHKFEAGGISLPEAVQSSAPFRSAIQAGARKSTGVGANLQGSEQEQMNGVSILLRDIALGKVTGSDWLKKLHAIQDMTTSSVRQSVTSNTPGLRIRKDSAPGRVLARQEQDAKREEVEMEQVRAALQGKTSVAQHATLVMLAKNGSRVAQNLLKKKQTESFIGRTKQLFGIGQDDDE